MPGPPGGMIAYRAGWVWGRVLKRNSHEKRPFAFCRWSRFIILLTCRSSCFTRALCRLCCDSLSSLFPPTQLLVNTFYSFQLDGKIRARSLGINPARQPRLHRYIHRLLPPKSGPGLRGSTFQDRSHLLPGLGELPCSGETSPTLPMKLLGKHSQSRLCLGLIFDVLYCVFIVSMPTLNHV